MNYVVRITSRGYQTMFRHTDREAAKTALLGMSLRLGPVVLRDGVTGKRFSWEELKAEGGR